jgi:hypothetical protein
MLEHLLWSHAIFAVDQSWRFSTYSDLDASWSCFQMSIVARGRFPVRIALHAQHRATLVV